MSKGEWSCARNCGLYLELSLEAIVVDVEGPPFVVEVVLGSGVRAGAVGRGQAGNSR